MSDGKTPDAEINEALARAVGWKTGPLIPTLLDGTPFPGWDTPPDYFSHRGSADLEDWLHAKGWSIEVFAYPDATSVSVERRENLKGTREQVRGQGSAARRRALAIVAWQALCAPTGGPDAT